MEEKILALILDKLEMIDKEQKEMRQEQLEMKKEIFKRLDLLEEGQESIKKFMFNAERAFESYDQDHRLIEKLKKVVCE